MRIFWRLHFFLWRIFLGVFFGGVFFWQARLKKLEENYDNFKPRERGQKNKKNKKNDPVFKNLFPKCEPQLGKRGVYANIGGVKEQDSLKQKKAIQWILNLSDGKYSLHDIEKKSGLDYDLLCMVADLLKDKKLLSEIDNESR